MTAKRGRNRSKAGKQVTQNIIDKVEPNTSDSLNNRGTFNNPAHEGDSRLEKRYKRLNQRFQLLGFIVAALTVLLTYWNIRLQSLNNSLQSAQIDLQSLNNRLQSDQSDYEKNQRVVELAVSLGAYWEERLDQDTRHRTYRFMLILESLNSSPERQKAFLQAFLSKNNHLDSSSVGNNKDLKRLLDPKFRLDNPSGAAPNLSVELSKYRSALVRLLNTLELIAIVRKYTNDPEAKKVLKYAYESSIKQRYKALEPFVREYQNVNAADRDVPAWYLLDEMVKEMK